MPTLRGCEFHCFDPSDLAVPGEFIRFIQMGSTMLTTQGTRGTPGQDWIHRYDTERGAAAEFTAQRLRRARDHKFYHRARVTTTVPADTKAIEFTPYFLAAWADAVFAPRHNDPSDLAPRWAIVTGALAERANDHGVVALLNRLMDGPHAIDHTADAVVGIVPRQPYLHPDTNPDTGPADAPSLVGRAIVISTLAPLDDSCPHDTLACGMCTQRMADLLLFLCRGLDLAATPPDTRLRMVATARRLLRSHLDLDVPTPAH